MEALFAEAGGEPIGRELPRFSLPIKLGFCIWWLLIFAGWSARKPFSSAENAAVAFICELEKQICLGLVLLGEGQSAISNRARVAHSISNPGTPDERLFVTNFRR